MSQMNWVGDICQCFLGKLSKFYAFCMPCSFADSGFIEASA